MRTNITVDGTETSRAVANWRPLRPFGSKYTAVMTPNAGDGVGIFISYVVPPSGNVFRNSVLPHEMETMMSLTDRGLPRRPKPADGAVGRETLHLTDRNFVELFQALTLGQSHMNEFGVHALHIGQD